MAWPDLSDLQTEIRTALRVPTSVRKLTDTILTRFINDAQREVAIEGLCIEDQVAKTTTASSRLVSYSGYHTVKRVEYVPDETSENTVTLQKIAVNQLGRMNYVGDHPQYYALWGGYVLIDPISTLVYNLIFHVAKAPTTELSAATDEPQIPKSLIQVLTPASSYRYFIRFRQWANVVSSYNEYATMTKAIRGLYVDKPDEQESSYIAPDVVQMGG